jgi:hypothetical protein
LLFDHKEGAMNLQTETNTSDMPSRKAVRPPLGLTVIGRLAGLKYTIKSLPFKAAAAAVMIMLLGPAPGYPGIGGGQGDLAVPARSARANQAAPSFVQVRPDPAQAGPAEDAEDMDTELCRPEDTGPFRSPEQHHHQPAARAIGPDRPGQPMLLAAMGSQDGAPPCGKDGICNLAACSDDPDCPAGLPEHSSNGSGDDAHNQGGSGHSVWFSTGEPGFEGGHYCPPNGETCDIMVHWSVQPDKYDKWKICWKEYGSLFTNACDENQKIRKFENNFYQIPNLKLLQKYRIRLEGRKDKNDKWKCLAKATLRNISLNDTVIASAVPCLVP